MFKLDKSLRQQHRELENRFRSLLAQAREDDQVQLRSQWLALLNELDAHMAFEESQLLPALGRQYPREEAELRREHGQIRATLTALGIELDLHLLRAESVEGFITTLREHARREDGLLYPFSAVDNDRPHPDWPKPRAAT